MLYVDGARARAERSSSTSSLDSRLNVTQSTKSSQHNNIPNRESTFRKLRGGCAVWRLRPSN